MSDDTETRETASTGETSSVGARGRAVSLDELRARASQGNEASIDASGFSKMLSQAVGMDRTELGSFRLPAFDQLAQQQAELARWQEELDRELEQSADDVAEVLRQRAEGADAQAQATIAIAAAQERFQDLQARGLELATAQSAAIAELAQVQQQTLDTIQEELEVLRAQQVALKNQSAGQRQLIKSGYAGGLVLEWTLLVTFLALVATIVLGFVPTDEIPTGARATALTVVVAGSMTLGISQWRRRPRS